MVAWPTDVQPFGQNHAPLLIGLSSTDATKTVPIAVDPTDGSVEVNANVVLSGSPVPIVGATTAVGVAIVDGSGNQITSFGGGTQYAEGATTSPGTGTLSMGRYLTSPPSLTNGQLYGLQLDGSGNLKVTGSLSVGGTTDNSAFTAGSSTGNPIMGFYHSTVDTVTDGRSATVGMTSKRALFVNLQTAAGAETGVAAAPLQVSLANTSANATAVKVDGSAVTQPVSLSSTTITGTVAVTQATASNLNATVVGTGTFAVQAAQSGTWVVVGSKTHNNAAPSTDNIGVLPALVNASSPSLTEGDQSLLSIDTAGNARVTVNKLGGSAINTGNGVTGPGTQRVTLSSDSTGQVALASGSNTIGALTANQSVNVALMNGATVAMNNGVVGTGTQRVTLASDSTGQVAPAASATATGALIYNNTALSSTKQAVNASAGNMYGYHIYNPNSTVIYVQLFNLASGSVTVGTTAPTAVLAVPAGGWVDAPPATPIAFATALTIAATATPTGSGAPTTALLCNIWYK
jgi:hypothetical protein